MYKYNPVLLERLVKRLHRNARIGMVVTPLIIAVIGAGIGAGYAYWAHFYLVKDLLVYGIVGAVVGLLVGILAGLSGAAKAREQAQIALGILSIEQNTRPAQLDTQDFIPLDTSA